MPNGDAPDKEGTSHHSATAGDHTPHSLALAAFTATTFLSAVLVFSVQPLFAKMVLPYLGGSPSVWAVALLFFQSALLAGYCYAHFLIARIPAAMTGFIHLILFALAFIFLPIAVPEAWGDPPETDPYFWQLGLFTAAIGLPFLVVSANAPLLQAWFARTQHPHARDPYFLYAASNLGSFLALLSFPFVLEPVFGVSSLSTLWAWSFALLAALVAACFYLVRTAQDPQPDTFGSLPSHNKTSDAGAASGWIDRLGWIGLAFVPAALLTAFTTRIATDVASAPLIWVIPLSLYLLTFVFVFREKALIPPRLLLGLHLVAVTLALLQLSQTQHGTWYFTSAVGAAAFFTSGLVAHRALYDSRPAVRHLTEFYLCMSLGGALGGLFAALVAPKIFSEVLEYPILLALTLACRPGAISKIREKAESLWFWGTVALGLGLIVLVPMIGEGLDTDFGGWQAAAVISALLAILVFVFWDHAARQLAAGLMMCAAVVSLPSDVRRGAAERSYFGVYRVVTSDDGQFNVLKHGTTLHGAQRVRDKNMNPVVDIVPKTYYYPGSPMAHAIETARAYLPEEDRPGRYGIVGLGAGSLACLWKAGETWRFYEIDPVVLRIAQSDKFTYLSHCQPEADVVIGDARLTLAKENDASFDLLLIDAFSSDAVPMHLLTVEALELYLRKLKPSGLGVFHISNRYLDLEGVIAAIIPEIEGLRAFVIEDPRPEIDHEKIGSRIVVFSKDLEVVHRFMRRRGARTPRWADLKPWTDDSSDVLGPLISRARQRF